jgi:cell division protein FtsQ
MSVSRWLIKTTPGRVVMGISALLILGALAASVWMVREFLRTDPRFRVASSEQIEVDGNREVSSDDVRSVFGEDIGRNLFFIPIELRRQEMEGLPWVERASVERLLPNRIHVRVTERVPVAFAQNGGELQLIDRHGVLLTMPTGAGAPQYSFPVLRGVGDDVPLSTRKARMDQYAAFLADVDGHGEKVSSQLSEVDLSEPEDVQALIAEGNSAITLHFGDTNYFERYQMYQAHLAEWQQQYPRLAKVDLRNAPQVVLGMGDAATTKSPAADTPLPAATTPAPEAAATSPEAKESAAAAPAPVPAKTVTARANSAVKTAAVKSKAKAVAAWKTAGAKHPAAAKPVVTAIAKPAPAPPPSTTPSNTAALQTFNNEAPKTPAQASRPRLVMRTQLPQATASTPTGVQP